MKFTQRSIYYFIFIFILSMPCQAAFVVIPVKPINDTINHILSNPTTHNPTTKTNFKKHGIKKWKNDFLSKFDGDIGLISFISALLAVFSFFIIFLFGIPFAIIAIILGITALKRKEKRKGLSIAAIVMGGLFVLASITSILFLLLYLGL